jgi:hypothetical protein
VLLLSDMMWDIDLPFVLWPRQHVREMCSAAQSHLRSSPRSSLFSTPTHLRVRVYSWRTLAHHQQVRPTDALTFKHLFPDVQTDAQWAIALQTAYQGFLRRGTPGHLALTLLSWNATSLGPFSAAGMQKLQRLSAMLEKHPVLLQETKWPQAMATGLHLVFRGSQLKIPPPFTLKQEAGQEEWQSAFPTIWAGTLVALKS